MTDRELMQMALDALKEYVGVVVSVNDPNDWTPKVADAGEPARKAIEALRARLAQPDHLIQMREVLAVQGTDGNWDRDPYMAGMFNGMELMMAIVEGREPVFRDPPERWLHTPPQREWQVLTDEERYLNEPRSAEEIEYAKAIEAKLKEKNND